MTDHEWQEATRFTEEVSHMAAERQFTLWQVRVVLWVLLSNYIDQKADTSDRCNWKEELLKFSEEVAIILARGDELADWCEGASRH